MITLFINYCAIALCCTGLLAIYISTAWLAFNMIEGTMRGLHLLWILPSVAVLSAAIITILGKLL